MFNALGFRGPDHVFPKAPGVRRAVVLGDSFSEAVHVNLAETYWHRLESLLSGATGTALLATWRAAT